MSNDLLTIKEAAELLALSEQTLRRWDRAGKLKPQRHPGNRYRLYARDELLALSQEIRSESAAIARATPPPSTGSTNLVAAVSSFVGRGDALERIDALFARNARLVTIIGPPGVGKTRLARRWIELQRAPFLAVGGVWFCDAAGLVDDTDLRAAIANVLGLRAVATRGVLAEAMSRRGALLLLVDDAEGLAMEARRTLHAIASAAPDARILVTSRERLRVEGEATVELTPLGLPNLEASTEEIARSEAAQLLFDRAPSETREPKHARAVAELVRALDGLPLAIEIAAAQLQLATPEEVLSRMDHKLDLQARDDVDARSRHASLRAALDASWSALEPAARRALAQCAVFAGSFTLEAAEAILTPSGEAARASIARLRDASLLASHASSGASRRFVLLESVRAHAAEQLRAGDEMRAVHARHASYYLERARVWERALRERGDLAARRKLAEEQAQLVAVMRRAKRGELPTPAQFQVMAALALDVPMAMQGRFAELSAMFEEIAPLAATGDPAIYARVLVARGHARGTTGDLAGSIVELERGVALIDATEDDAIRAEAHVMLLVRYRQAGRFEEAVAAGERAREIAHALPHLEATARVNLGLVLGELGRVDEARAHDEAARKVFHAMGDPWSEGLALGNLAQLDQAAGEWERARHYYDETRRVFRDANDLLFEAVYSGFSAALALEEAIVSSDPEPLVALARERLDSSIRLLASGGVAHMESLFLAYAAALEATLGDRARAATLVDRANLVFDRAQVPGHLAARDALFALLDLPSTWEAARRRALEHAGTSSDVRTAIRLLDASLRARGMHASDWTVAADARWAKAPDGATIQLDRRGSLRRILDALVSAHATSPGAALSRDALLHAGWPGERVLHDAASKRVRVAITTLRNLGLRGAILTRDDGYLLDARLSFLRNADSPRD